MKYKLYLVSVEEGYYAFRRRWAAKRAFAMLKAEDQSAVLSRFDQDGVQHILDTNVSRKPSTGFSKPSKG